MSIKRKRMITLIVLLHSGHGLQNDNDLFHFYYQKMEEYLDTYLPVG